MGMRGPVEPAADPGEPTLGLIPNKDEFLIPEGRCRPPHGRPEVALNNRKVPAAAEIR
jgi:hypothetical protein